MDAGRWRVNADPAGVPPAPPTGRRRAAPHVPPGIWVLVGLGLLSYGISSPLVRLAGDVPGLAIAAWRCAMVSALLLPVVLVRERAALAALPARDWALIVGAGAFLGVHFVAWILSVQLTTIAAASVLVTTTPLWIAVLGTVVGERPSRATALAILGGVAGAALIGWGSTSDQVAVSPSLGNALALGAAALVSVYLLAGRSVRQRHSFLVYFAPVNAVAALVTVGACVVVGVPLALPWPVLGVIAVMAVGPGLLGHGSFAAALRWVPAATLGLLGLAEPVLASAIAAVAFGEIPSAASVAGMGVVLLSIASVLVRRAG